jgi:hypothetical protein
MAQSTIKGRAIGAGTGDPTDLTADQALDVLQGATDWGSWERIASTLLAANAASISFQNIPATYEHLKLVIQARTAEVATTSVIALRFNNDTANNYTYQYGLHQAANTTAGNSGGAVSYILLGNVPAGNATANAAGNIHVIIPNYRRTTFNKGLVGQWSSMPTPGTIANFQIGQCGGNWNSTAAISRIDIFPGANNLAAGTVATLYGAK